MSPRQLKVTLCLFALALAGAVFFLPTGGKYVEYAAVEVAPLARPVVASPKASVASPVVVASAPEARPAEFSKSGAISLGGVSAAMTPSSRQVLGANKGGAGFAGQSAGLATSAAATPAYRPAFLASITEREEAADAAGIPREGFVKACDRDHDLYLSRSEKIPFYACSGLAAPIGPDVTSVTTTPSYPTTQTFILHSRPSATRKIYLDFTGHTITDTRWNTIYSKVSFTVPPFSSDADTTKFSTAEHALIQYVWRSVAEDYAQFDVDVTTEDPGVDALRRTSLSDVNHGMRVVIGPDQNATGKGGHGLLGSFGYLLAPTKPDEPVLVYGGTVVFTAKAIAECCSHEVGHSLNLSHDGTLVAGVTTEYFPGHGTGATSWAPIMGVGYYKDIVQWSKGEYTDANNKEDDIAIIGLRIPPVADDHAGTMAAATVVTGTTITGGGLINNANDVDMFKINAGRGKLVITPKGVLVSPNLRLQVKILKSDGTVLGTYDAAGTKGKMAPDPITYNVTEDGTYYIQLDGIANGAGVTDGYSEYASVGIYGLNATWIEPGNKPPIPDTSLTGTLAYDYQAQPSAAVNFNGTLSYDPDGLIVSYRWDFADVYPQTASGPTATHRYRAPGTYKPTLTVTDDRGASTSTMLTVDVSGPIKQKTFSVALNSASFVRVNSVSDAVDASVNLQDQYGNPLKGAIVDLRFSGLVNSPVIGARTDIYGNIVVRSPLFKRFTHGTVNVVVESVSSATHTYRSSDNLSPTSVSVTF
jgi:PKD repeat protein